MNKKKIITYPSFKEYLAEQMKDEGFKKAFKEEGKRLELAYRILQLHKQKKLSQKEFPISIPY